MSTFCWSSVFITEANSAPCPVENANKHFVLEAQFIRDLAVGVTQNHPKFVGNPLS